MTDSAAPRILVVEDDDVVSETLALYLGQAGYAVDRARDGVTGLERARSNDIALVVLDLMIPGINGQEVCRRLRQVSTVPILMLTARASEDERITGLQLGADDYVAKPFSPREIVARVQALLRRAADRPPAPPPPIRVGEVEIDLWGRQVRLRGKPVPLTATEYRLLEALARHPGRTFTRDELVARAFGPDFEGLDRTVDAHITNLRRKLEPDDRQRYVLTVHGLGYRLASPHAE